MYEEKIIKQNSKPKVIQAGDLEIAIEQTNSSLLDWCNQMKDDMLDGRYPGERILRKGIDPKYGFILDEIAEVEKSLRK